MTENAQVIATVRAALEAVVDPEIPVLTIDDLGVLRDVAVGDDGRVEVTITPTYSGCPAMDTIRADIECVLAESGFAGATVRTILAPAWTTDWMTEAGKRKLAEAGIAPPCRAAGTPVLPSSVPPEKPRRNAAVSGKTPRKRWGAPEEPPPLGAEPVPVELVRCPRCGSADTRLISRFGSTACKALRACNRCLEPFDHFKTL